MVMIQEISKQGKMQMDIESYMLANNRTIYLNGDVTDKSVMEIIRQITYLNDKSNDDITIVINSTGGSVTAGMALYDVIQNSNAKINCICCGVAMSIAAIILVGATGTRKAYKHAEIMIHQPIGGVQGQVTDIVISCERVKRMKQMLNRLLAEKTNKPIDKIEDDTERDYFMTAQEAKEYGIIDEVL